MHIGFWPIVNGYDIWLRAPPRSGKTLTSFLALFHQINTSLSITQALIICSSFSEVEQTEQVYHPISANDRPQL
jgi:superfamily II DNA/RNA helicase